MNDVEPDFLGGQHVNDFEPDLSLAIAEIAERTLPSSTVGT